MQRITIAEVFQNEWFKKYYKPPVFEAEEVSNVDVRAIFDESLVIKILSSLLSRIFPFTGNIF